mmetsp:Transcript_6538/g.26227  ORF Transcript_6538/g.26227 Transcript_6538/m.26227 type:complete len:201 (-) Transcript_6538:1696-2298(-)
MFAFDARATPPAHRARRRARRRALPIGFVALCACWLCRERTRERARESDDVGLRSKKSRSFVVPCIGGRLEASTADDPESIRFVIHHLKRINLFGGSVPQGPKRHQLEAILRQSWPELLAFNEQSMLRVEVGSQGDRRTTGRVARTDTAAVARACESPPLGCASCRGRLEGCKRCIKWRDEGRIPSTTSKSGFQVWTAPE